MRRGYFLPPPAEGAWESVMSFPKRVPHGASAKNEFGAF